ncbi:sensor histidine kinase [Gemmiger sp.]
MKTFTRLIRRYVLATAAVILLVVGLLLGLTVWAGLHYGETSDDRARIGTLAEALTPTADGLQFDPTRTPAEWMRGYAWAMVLDDDGAILWQYDLPENLHKRYTASEIASFSHWYLDDWPVFCWTADYGLFVAAVPRGSVWKYNIYNNADMMRAMAAGLLPTLALLLGAVLGCCLWFGWRGARRLQSIAMGLDTVADGGTVCLPTNGFAGELADTVNRTSEQLRRRNEIIARRDDARTNWIAGVSHDVRTPLALILGRAEQLEHDAALPAAARRKAADIRTQSEKLRTLIEDLNLTSKLQYGAQPLRRKPTQMGPLLRKIAAEFCDSSAAAACTPELKITPEADKAVLDVDAALLTRAMENLLNNAARHNAGPVNVTVTAEQAADGLQITVADDGAGYPPAVLHALHTGETGENTPHILGLHVVEQIIEAHGGQVTFTQNEPHGAKAVIFFTPHKKSSRF